MRNEQMIDKMIETFKENYNEEIYGKSFSELMPKLIEYIFEKDEIWKLINIYYYSKLTNKINKHMIPIGEYRFLHANKDNFHEEQVNSVPIFHEIINVYYYHLSRRFYFNLFTSIPGFENTFNSVYGDEFRPKEMSEKFYSKCNDILKTFIVPKSFLNVEDLKLLENKKVVGVITHLRDNIYVDVDEYLFKQHFMEFHGKLCDYTPTENIVMIQMLKDRRYQILFDCSVSDFNKDIKFYF